MCGFNFQWNFWILDTHIMDCKWAVIHWYSGRRGFHVYLALSNFSNLTPNTWYTKYTFFMCFLCVEQSLPIKLRVFWRFWQIKILFKAWLHWSMWHHQMSFEKFLMLPIGTLSFLFFCQPIGTIKRCFKGHIKSPTPFSVTKPLQAILNQLRDQQVT